MSAIKFDNCWSYFDGCLPFYLHFLFSYLVCDVLKYEDHILNFFMSRVPHTKYSGLWDSVNGFL